jgi:hypothetical protein
MIDIPQDVRVRVAAKLYSVVNRDDSFRLADAIIPLAQLPIAPATEAEIAQAVTDFHNRTLDEDECMAYVINNLFSRRNSPPPQVDPLAEKIGEVLCAETTINTPGTTRMEVAKKIAAVVRILAALDAMKEKG